MSAVATSYLWCAERPALSSLPVAAGLAVNVTMNLLLVPRFGLQGAVLEVKLRRLDEWNAARARHAQRYRQLLADVAGLVLPRRLDS